MSMRAAVLPMGATPLTVYTPRYQRLTQVVTAAIKYCLHPFFANNKNNDDKTRKHAAIHERSLSLPVYLSICLYVWISLLQTGWIQILAGVRFL